MKKICIISTHLDSGVSLLNGILDLHPQLEIYQLAQRNVCSTGLDLLRLTEKSHKMKNKTAIYLFENNYNHQIIGHQILNLCKFIYLVRRPEETIPQLVVNRKIGLDFAINYYFFRLRRISQLCKYTPNAIFLTYEDVKKSNGIHEIESYLNLKDNLKSKFLSFHEEKEIYVKNFDYKLIQKLETKYEKYISWIKTQTKVWHYQHN